MHAKMLYDFPCWIIIDRKHEGVFSIYGIIEVLDNRGQDNRDSTVPVSLSMMWVVRIRGLKSWPDHHQNQDL